ncbi:MAG: excinuclease ABC subunit UvrC [Candidatus Hinthialibacter antarcticus]|nr:excinuclease ABC subunit UvrC [Candidatus Hinthialibacter antarcticus]
MITREQIALLPNQPGVYLMHDAQGRVAYVGKAIDIQKRIRSHCARKNGAYASPFVEVIQEVKPIITDSDEEALLLEYNLIKKYHPEFNIKLKDDKRYPYIKITNEEFPRAYLTRSVDSDGAQYFGPYPHVTQARRALSALHEIFPIRPCKYESKKLLNVRPCLDYEMGRCCAPCGGVVTNEEYASLCNGVSGFLRGKHDDVIHRLKARMEECSRDLYFEKAAFYRDILEAADQFAIQQKMLRNTVENQDFIGYTRVHETACIGVIRRRNGRVVGTSNHLLDGASHAEAPEALYAFLIQFYARNTDVPREIFLPASIGKERLQSLENSLSKIKERTIAIKTPHRGMKHAMLQLAEKNSRHHAENHYRKLHGVKHSVADNVITLQESLKLEVLPLRIEGYDIANTQGDHSVGAMVVFQDGQPQKSSYRRFKIKDVEGQDDYACMQEMLRRRFSHGDGDDAEKKRFAKPPDLIMIDGGKGHLHAAMEALDELDIPNFPICGLAKKEELIYLPGLSEPVRLERRNLGLRLLQFVRDEAHRFGNAYNAKLRGKRVQHSSLRNIKGVGPAKERALLKHFGSVAKIKTASPDELCSVPGVTEELAQRIINS